MENNVTFDTFGIRLNFDGKLDEKGLKYTHTHTHIYPK